MRIFFTTDSDGVAKTSEGERPSVAHSTDLTATIHVYGTDEEAQVVYLIPPSPHKQKRTPEDELEYQQKGWMEKFRDNFRIFNNFRARVFVVVWILWFILNTFFFGVSKPETGVAHSPAADLALQRYEQSLKSFKVDAEIETRLLENERVRRFGKAEVQPKQSWNRRFGLWLGDWFRYWSWRGLWISFPFLLFYWVWSKRDELQHLIYEAKRRMKRSAGVVREPQAQEKMDRDGGDKSYLDFLKDAAYDYLPFANAILHMFRRR